MRFVATTIVLLGCLTWLGCGDSPAPTAQAPPVQNTGEAGPPPPEPEAAGNAAKAPAATAPASAPAAAPANEPAAEEDAPGEGETKSPIGASGKGQDYGGPGFVTTPIETLFRIEDRVIFQAQIPNNMKIYKAQHNNKGPKTQEEFMEAIIKEGGITLPELPDGEAYWYNPKTEELLVRHKK
jgi:hypothetical protein